jgi:hypothetical protein
VEPRALQILASDPDAHVRAHAVGLVGYWVHGGAAAQAALLEAMKSGPNSTVRKKAGWNAPGGPRYERTRPRPPRRQNDRSSPVS